ncbi:MAG: helix-turn-helix transcriptional regulator [Reichenbachiella sp.]|uniref:helix-turn-helix domain-containing protein n=1 Tax=Reichenbachiella sp. TaxID=2184521 RepID=UPI003296E13E
MIETLYFQINTLAAYSLIISAILVIKDRKRIRGAYAIIGFMSCVFLYLVIDFVTYPVLKWIFVLGPFLLPFSFWMMARTFFNDEPYANKRALIYVLTTSFVYYILYLLGNFSYWTKASAIAGRALSIFFIVLAMIETQSGKRTDLDDQRIRLRKYFTYFIGLVVFITTLSELGLSKDEQELPKLVQRSAILLLNTLFIGINFSIKSLLFDSRKKNAEVNNPDLIDKIQRFMIEQEFYRKEKLTIGQLAEALEEQEYKTRRVINQEMGYRNFTDFINSYRIREATDLLKDRTKSKLTILEIAYKIGFNSIGPFNRTFKQATGFTPTDYRKKHMNS